MSTFPSMLIPTRVSHLYGIVLAMGLFAGIHLSASAESDTAIPGKRILEVPISAAPSYAKRALVIGVTDYEQCSPLTVCNNDALAFAKMLEDKFGFSDITVMTDAPGTKPALRPTRAHIRKAMDVLLNQVVADQSEVVIFYSGHGVRTQDKTNGDMDWLVPEDGDPSDVAGSCVNYSAIKQRLDTARPRRGLLIVDACRSLLTGKGAGSSGFGGSTAPILGSEVAELLSCQPTQVSQEGLKSDFPESVFTHFLIKGLEGDPNATSVDGHTVTFDSLKVFVQGMVSQYVASKFNAEQWPDGRASLGGMVLASTGDAPKPNAPPHEPPHLTSLQQLIADTTLVCLWQNHNSPTQTQVRKVLAGGANVNARDAENCECTPLMAASESGDVGAVNLLLDSGADVNAKDTNGWTPLMYVGLHGRVTLERLRLSVGRDMPTRSTHLASLADLSLDDLPYIEIVKLLISHGASINIRDKSGKTALTYAKRLKLKDIAKFLERSGGEE